MDTNTWFLSWNLYHCLSVYSFECCVIILHPIWGLKRNIILTFVFILKYCALLEFGAKWTNIDTNTWCVWRQLYHCAKVYALSYRRRVLHWITTLEWLTDVDQKQFWMHSCGIFWLVVNYFCGDLTLLLVINL